jgi:hypothetical protein
MDIMHSLLCTDCCTISFLFLYIYIYILLTLHPFPQMMRKRDVAVIGVVLLAVYLSLQSSHNNYVLEPSWYFDQPMSAGGVMWKQLPPIITDLDGDGSREILLITKSLSLMVSLIVSL